MLLLASSSSTDDSDFLEDNFLRSLAKGDFLMFARVISEVECFFFCQRKLKLDLEDLKWTLDENSYKDVKVIYSDIYECV